MSASAEIISAISGAIAGGNDFLKIVLNSKL